MFSSVRPLRFLATSEVGAAFVWHMYRHQLGNCLRKFRKLRGTGENDGKLQIDKFKLEYLMSLNVVHNVICIVLVQMYNMRKNKNFLK